MTDFASLGLDPATIASDLETLGVDVSAYYDETTGEYSDELASMMLAANLVLKQGIFETATQVEELIGDYQLQADVLNSMSETLELAHRDTFGATDGTVKDLIDFLRDDVDYATIDDLDSYEFDSSLGILYTTDAFETLDDYINGIENNTEIGVNESSRTQGTLVWELLGLIQANWATGFYDATGASASEYEFLDSSGDVYLQVPVKPQLALNVYVSLEGFKNYLVLNALQDAGIVSDDLDLSLVNFADTSFYRSSDYPESAGWAEWVQLYYGTSSYRIDDDGALVVTHSGSAMCVVMGLDLEEYAAELVYDIGSSNEDGDWIADLPSPMNGTELNAFFEATATYAFGHIVYPLAISEDKNAANYGFDSLWPTYKNQDLTTDGKWIDAENLDDILEGMASQIQSQASISQLALVETSTAITEWSEFHNGWDTAHKYITEALGRCMAFLK